MSAEEAPVWVLLGQKTGDNNQLLRLAGELGRTFRTIELSYNGLYRVPPRLMGASLASLTGDARSKLRPPWPDLILGIGNRSVPAALAIARQSAGRAKLVRLGNPRFDPGNFDLVITTPQYPVADAPNVIRLPLGISTAPLVEPTDEEKGWLQALPRPHRLLLVGGDTFMWRLSTSNLAKAATTLAGKNGSVIAASSPRSRDEVVDSVARALDGSAHAMVRRRFPRYPVLLADADEIHVTADSVAMVSDSIATGKPVGLVLPEKTASGRLFYGLAKFGLPVPVRDIRRFWSSVLDERLAGTIDRPVAGKMGSDPLAMAVAAVLKLLD